MECSLRFQREIAVHQFHILESILKEDSHICPKRKYKKFSLYAIVYNKKKEENNMLGIKATHKKLLVERNTEKERIKW